jgi:xylose isomerase
MHISWVIEALSSKGYVFWGGREGYETLLNTNMGLELDNMARLMKLTVDYARSKGYTGDFYIEPKPKEPTKHQYDFDTATVLGFLRKYGLDKDFKMNIEANHATLAQHTFQHELRVARDNGVFGSIDANQGDPLLGWDTDQFPTNAYDATIRMACGIRDIKILHPAKNIFQCVNGRADRTTQSNGNLPSMRR